MVIAVDLGTTSVKAALFHEDGSCLALRRAPVRSHVGAHAIEHEIDPDDWTRAVEGLLSVLASIHPGGLSAISCVVVSGNGPTILPVDAKGSPLHRAITWMDRRASEESALAADLLGRSLDPAYNLPKTLWFKRKKPEIYAKTRHFISCPEFVIAKLTDLWVSILPAEGYQSIIWNDGDLAALELDASKFPPFVKLGSIVGEVTAEASAWSKIPEGVPVVAGGPDFIVSLLGTATTKPRRACDRSGTSEGINLCWDSREPVARDPRLLFMPHVIDPYENISGVISASGRAVSWFSGFSGSGYKTTEEFFADAVTVSPGADNLLFLPYLAGERAPLWDPAARGAFIGLSLRHGKAHMARAIAESTGFAIRDVIEVMAGLGAGVRELRVTGQPARNSTWNQMKADISGVPVLVPAFGDAELLGDLCLARHALGRAASLQDAAESLVSIERVFEPSTSTRALYDDLFGLYRRSYLGLKPVFAALGAAGARSSARGVSGSGVFPGLDPRTSPH